MCYDLSVYSVYTYTYKMRVFSNWACSWGPQAYEGPYSEWYMDQIGRCPIPPWKDEEVSESTCSESFATHKKLFKSAEGKHLQRQRYHCRALSLLRHFTLQDWGI